MEEIQPKRKGLLGRIKSSLKGAFQETPGEIDVESGVQKPGRSSAAERFLNVLVPMMMAKEGGVGMLPGITTGAMMNRGSQVGRQKQYETEREKTIAQKLSKYNAETGRIAATRPSADERQYANILSLYEDLAKANQVSDAATSKAVGEVGRLGGIGEAVGQVQIPENVPAQYKPPPPGTGILQQYQPPQEQSLQPKISPESILDKITAQQAQATAEGERVGQSAMARIAPKQQAVAATYGPKSESQSLTDLRAAQTQAALSRAKQSEIPISYKDFRGQELKRRKGDWFGSNPSEEELLKLYKESFPSGSSNGEILVREKSSGTVGTIPPGEFDPKLYEKM